MSGRYQYDWSSFDKIIAEAKANGTYELTGKPSAGALTQALPDQRAGGGTITGYVSREAGFPAKFPGFCQRCQSGIEVGARIESAQPKGYQHVTCQPVARVETPVAQAEATRTFSEAMRRFFAVENAEGTLVFLRVTKTEKGWTYVDQVVGGQGELPRAKVTPDGRYIGAMQASYAKAMADPEAALIRYGLEIGRCGHCNRVLTDASSRAAGIGPVCAGKAGF